MKKFIFYLLLFEVLLSFPLIGAEFEQNLLQLCSVISKDLSSVSSDCVGPCENKDGAAYKSQNLDSFYSKLQAKGIEESCEFKAYKKMKDRKKKKAILCRCNILKRYPDFLKHSCKRNTQNVYLVKSPMDSIMKKFALEMQTKFHNRYSLLGLVKSIKGEKVDCWSDIEKSSSKEQREQFFLTNQKQLDRDDTDLKSYLESFFNQRVEGVKVLEDQQKKIDKEVENLLDGKTVCERIISDINETMLSWDILMEKGYNLSPNIINRTESRVITCLGGHSEISHSLRKKRRPRLLSLQNASFGNSVALQSISIKRPVPSDTKLSKISMNQESLLADSVSFDLYTPDGKKVKGRTTYEILKNHRRSWLTHTLEKLVPYVSELDQQGQWLREELITENDPERRKEILSELDGVNEAKREVEKTLAEAKSFDEVDNPKSRVAEQEDKTSQQKVPSVKTGSATKEITRKVSTGFNKGFDVKSIFGNKSKFPSPVLPAQKIEDVTVENLKVTPRQKERGVASRTGDKVSKDKGENRAPSSIKSTSSSFTGGSAKSSGSGGSFVASPSVPTTPRYLFVEEQKEDPKVGAMIDRLSDGDVYAFVNPKQKRVKIYKKQRQTQVFMTEKSVAELNEMGVNIDESRLDSISKITFKDKRIFFHYEDGSYQEGNLLDVRSSKELESLF